MGRKKSTEEQSATNFPKKWLKKLEKFAPGFVEEGESMSTEELKKKVLEWEQLISTTEKDMDHDEALTALKEEAKQHAQVYKDTVSAQQAKIRYAVYLLESRGAG